MPTQRPATPGGQPAPASNVVPLHRAEPAPPTEPGSAWAEARARLAEEDRVLFDAWFASLVEAGVRDGCLTLFAPSRFHASYVETHLIERLRIARKKTSRSGRLVRVELEVELVESAVGIGSLLGSAAGLARAIANPILRRG